jgi:hypothetical protein
MLGPLLLQLNILDGVVTGPSVLTTPASRAIVWCLQVCAVVPGRCTPRSAPTLTLGEAEVGLITMSKSAGARAQGGGLRKG